MRVCVPHSVTSDTGETALLCRTHIPDAPPWHLPSRIDPPRPAGVIICRSPLIGELHWTRGAASRARGVKSRVYGCIGRVSIPNSSAYYELAAFHEIGSRLDRQEHAFLLPNHGMIAVTCSRTDAVHDHHLHTTVHIVMIEIIASYLTTSNSSQQFNMGECALVVSKRADTIHRRFATYFTRRIHMHHNMIQLII
jgi:hypothetical protein